MWIFRLLTCALAANKIFALRLIWINGSDRYIIQGVWFKVLQEAGGVLIAQDVLRKISSVYWTASFLMSTGVELSQDNVNNYSD